MSGRQEGYKTAMLGAGNLVFIEFPFEGRMATAIIDTGANVLVIDPSVAVKKRFVRNATHCGGTKERKVSRVVEIPFPCLTTRKPSLTQALEAPLSHFRECLNRNVDFVIGFPILRKLVFTIDYPNKEVHFAASREDLPAKAWLEADFQGREIHLPVVIRGRRIERMLVDTGAGTCLLEPQVIESLGLSKIEEKIALAVDCHGRQRERPFFRASHVDFGGRRFNDVEFMESDHKDVNRNGIVGTNLLESFKVVVDYPRERIALL